MPSAVAFESVLAGLALLMRRRADSVRCLAKHALEQGGQNGCALMGGCRR